MRTKLENAKSYKLTIKWLKKGYISNISWSLYCVTKMNILASSFLIVMWQFGTKNHL